VHPELEGSIAQFEKKANLHRNRRKRGRESANQKYKAAKDRNDEVLYDRGGANLRTEPATSRNRSENKKCSSKKRGRGGKKA